MKNSLNPAFTFDEEKMTSWAAVESIISEKKVTLKNFDQLVDDISTSASLSLEFKCLVATAAVEACKLYQAEDDPKRCQEFFKSKDKSDKSKHIANFVSNRWLQESIKYVKASAATIDESANMHIKVLQAGLQFMKSAFVINTAKKVSVLKDKQNIDWQALQKRIYELSSANNLPSLLQSVESVKEHFDTFLSEGGKDSSNASTTEDKNAIDEGRRSKLQDIKEKKRLERMENIKRGAHATNLRRTSATAASLPAATLVAAPAPTNRLPPVAAAPRYSAHKLPWGTDSPKPEPKKQWNPKWGENVRAPAPPRVDPVVLAQASVAISSGPTSQQGTAHATDESAYHSHEEQSRGRSAAADGRSHGGYTASSNYNPNLDHQAHQKAAPSAFSVNAPAASQTSYRSDGYSHTSPQGGGPDQYSGEAPYNRGGSSDPVSGDQRLVPASDLSNDKLGGAWSVGAGWGGNDTWNASSSTTLSRNVGGARGSAGWGSDSSNNIAISHDNQTGDRGIHSDNFEPTKQQDFQRHKRRPPPDNNRSNKRPRNNFAPRDANQPPAPGAGRGRGRGQTLPAWMTEGTASVDGPSGLNSAPVRDIAPPSADYSSVPGPVGRGNDPRSFDRGPPPHRENNFPPPNAPAGGGRGREGGRGRGRGREVNQPAWMTHGTGSNGPQGASPHDIPAAPRSNVGPPQARGGFPDVGTEGGGRGRGRTLPAWMTDNKV